VENLIKARRQAPQLFDQLFDEGTRTILEEVTQLGNIVTEFTQFARLPAPRPEWADLEALVDQVASLYSSEPGLEVRRSQAHPLPRVLLDAEQISRALKNLVKNAVEAMAGEGGGGLLEVRTGLEGETVWVEVSDTGPGFPLDTAGRIFEPYFTTKQKGTGLGMAIALRIISEHGGSLIASNRPGGGACVTVSLPVAGPRSVEEEADAAAGTEEGFEPETQEDATHPGGTPAIKDQTS
jgi:nitrogen fixation/metabolism regulation signal transduction histidine kinase